MAYGGKFKKLIDFNFTKINMNQREGNFCKHKDPMKCHRLGAFHLRNKFDFWNVHGIVNTLSLLQSKGSPKSFMITVQEIRSIHDSINRPKIEFIAYIYILS